MYWKLEEKQKYQVVLAGKQDCALLTDTLQKDTFSSLFRQRTQVILWNAKLETAK